MTHKGWGHSSTDDVINWAVQAGVKKLVLHHHEPTHSDEKLDEMEAYAKKTAKEKGADSLEVFNAREQLIIE